MLSDSFIVFLVVIFLCDFRVVGLFQEDELRFQIGLMLIIDNGAWILRNIFREKGFAVGCNVDKGIGLGEFLFNFIYSQFFRRFFFCFSQQLHILFGVSIFVMKCYF